MISHFAHGHVWYRCRHGYTSSTPAVPGQHRTLYLREDRLLDEINVALRASAHRERILASRIRGYLRDHDMVAVCSAEGVTLERDATPRRFS